MISGMFLKHSLMLHSESQHSELYQNYLEVQANLSQSPYPPPIHRITLSSGCNILNSLLLLRGIRGNCS